jgi:hypothetical protein
MNIIVTEILGTDSMNNSRITINNNFKTLADSIKQLERNLQQSFPSITTDSLTISGGTLVLGNVSLTSAQLQALINQLPPNEP